jgi:hypothetical protein
LDNFGIKMTLFGTEFHPVIIALLLYMSLGAWFVLAIVRNMKRDLDEIRLFTRWQGLLLIFYCNFMFYALFNPSSQFNRIGRLGSPNQIYQQNFLSVWSPTELANAALALNIVMIGIVGMTMMSPATQFKAWWRDWKAGRASYFTESGPVLPWLIAAALPGIICFGAYALSSSALGPMANWPFQHTGYILLVFLVFQVRDIMFLQLCLLTKMKRPVVAGMFFVLLYYFTTCIMAVTVAVKDQEISRSVFELLTPFGCLSEKSNLLSPYAIVGLAIQLGICGLLIMVNNQRLARKAFTPGTVAQAA